MLIVISDKKKITIGKNVCWTLPKCFKSNENVQVKENKLLKINSLIHTYSFISLDGELHAGRNAAGLLNLSSVHAVPMARTTRPDSPSKSKHCRYPTTAFPLISSTFKPIFLCSSPTKKEENSLCFISPHYMNLKESKKSWIFRTWFLKGYLIQHPTFWEIRYY